MNDVEKPSGGAETLALVMFAAELRSWRHQLGRAQTELGARIGYSDKLVSCIETCTRTPTLEFACACDREMNLPGTFERRHEDISRESFPPWFALAPSLEEKAVKIHNWDMSRIPGLVQTEDYARAVISSGRPGVAVHMTGPRRTECSWPGRPRHMKVPLCGPRWVKVPFIGTVGAAVARQAGRTYGPCLRAIPVRDRRPMQAVCQALTGET